jgi:hypothetical protein
VSVDRLKRDFLSAAQKYKKLFKENANPDDLDSFKRLMDVYIHLDDIADDEIQDLQSVTDEGNVTTNTIDTAGTTSDYFLLDTGATTTPEQGMLFWDADRQTAGLQMNGVEARLGQDNFWYVKNQSGSDILKGTVVMAVGALGSSSRILVAPMVADGSVEEQYLLGITAEDILNGEDGFVMNIGKIRGIDTTQYGTQAGQVLYCDPSVPGGLTITQPDAPNLDIPIAFTVDYKSNGTLAVRVNPGYHIGELHDVYSNSPSNNDILLYNSTNSRWENTPLASAVPTPTLDEVTTAGSTTTNDISVGDHSIVQFYRIPPGQGNAGFAVFYSANGTAATQTFLYAPGALDFAIKTYNNNSSSVGENIVFYAATTSVGIGTTANAGYKLDVNGTARVKGTGTTSSTTAFLVQNTNGDNLLEARDDQSVKIGNALTITNVGTRTTFSSIGGPNFNQFRFNTLGPFSATFGATTYIEYNVSFTPTSGTGTFSALYYSGQINQTGGANGITRGLYINPTLTSAYDFRAIETTAGKVVHQGLTNATQTDQVYYDSATGELTYGSLPVVATPTLDEVTTAGSNSTNNISITKAFPALSLDHVGTGTQYSGATIVLKNNLIASTPADTVMGTIAFTDSGGSSKASIVFSKGTNDANIDLKANRFATVDLRVATSGNTLIGTTTDAGYKLDVNGTVRSVKNKIDITPTTDTIALDIRGTGTPNDFFTVSNATGGANDVFLPIFFYKAATYGYNGGTNRYPSGVYGGGFIAAVDDTSYPSAIGAGAAMHFNSRTYANNGPLSNRYLFSWGSWLTTHMAMTAGGNLLIGTTTDSGEKLQINGNADISGDIYADGDVGIGNDAPAYKLDVSGDINADGDFYQNGVQGATGTVNLALSGGGSVTLEINGGIITSIV